MPRERAAIGKRAGASDADHASRKLPQRELVRFKRAMARYGGSLTLVVVEGTTLAQSILQIAGPSVDYFGGGESTLLNVQHGQVSFFLCHFGDQRASLDRFQRLARESGATVLARGLLDDVLRYATRPDVLWAFTVYRTLRESTWCRREGNATLFDAFAASVETWKRLVLRGGRSPGKKANSPKQEKRSWTQLDLDQAIRQYKAKRASNYADLKEGVAHNRSGAKKSARKMFGRNAIALALGVKGWAMVSKSCEWKEIADELQLRKELSTLGRHQGRRIGTNIALEEQAESLRGFQNDDVVRRETESLVKDVLPLNEANDVLNKLSRGEMTDDQARELVGEYQDQVSDSRTHKIRQRR